MCFKKVYSILEYNFIFEKIQSIIIVSTPQVKVDTISLASNDIEKKTHLLHIINSKWLQDHKDAFLEQMWESLGKRQEHCFKLYCTITWAWTSLEIYESGQNNILINKSRNKKSIHITRSKLTRKWFNVRPILGKPSQLKISPVYGSALLIPFIVWIWVVSLTSLKWIGKQRFHRATQDIKALPYLHSFQVSGFRCF